MVTAQRREQRLQDTPVAVTAFSSKSLVERGVTNLVQLGQFTPSLNVQPTNRGGGGGSSIAAYIRGVGTGDYLIPTDPAIGVYVDGVYIARSIGGLLSLPDIERIEVLKGPQGTLYGRNTLGGAISLVTEQPRLTGDVEGLLEGRVGTYDRRDVIASVNGPIVDDRIAAKLSVAWLDSDGYGKDDYTKQRLNNEDRIIVRGAVRFRFTPDLELTLDGDYTRQAERPPVASLYNTFAPPTLVKLFNSTVAPQVDGALALPAGSTFGNAFKPSSPYQSYASGPLRDDYDSGGVGATLAWRISPALQFKSITAIRSLQADIDVDADGTPYNILSEQTVARDVQVSQEFDLNGRLLNNKLTYVAGVYLFRELGHSSDDLQVFNGIYQATKNAALALNTNTFQRLDARSYAVFAQADYEFLPKFELTVGGRVNYDQKIYDAFVYQPQLSKIAIPDQASSPDFTSFTPKIGLNWKPTRQLLAYVDYAEGFKSGGISPPLVGVPLQTYQPEKLRSYEVGLKSEWFDRRLTANAAAYYSIHDDIQLTSLLTLPSGGIGKPVQNGGTADTYGYELEVVAVPTQGLTLNLAAAFTHARFSNVSPGVATALGAYVDERLPDIPDYNLNLGAQYVYPSRFGDVTVRADLSETGKEQLTIGDPHSYQNSYLLMNARIAFDPKAMPRLELSVEGTNLTNKTYFTYDQVVTAGQFQLVEVAPPTQLTLTARYKF